MYSQSEYQQLKLIYGIAVAERYKNLVSAPDYYSESSLEVREWEEKRGRPRSTQSQHAKESLPSCLNCVGVRLTPAKLKKILGAVAIFPSLRTHIYRFELTPRTLFATAKEMGFRYNLQLERWEFLDRKIKRRPT